MMKGITHDTCLPGFHHGTCRRCLFAKFSTLDGFFSLLFFLFLFFFSNFFLGGNLWMDMDQNKCIWRIGGKGHGWRTQASSFISR